MSKKSEKLLKSIMKKICYFYLENYNEVDPEKQLHITQKVQDPNNDIVTISLVMSIEKEKNGI